MKIPQKIALVVSLSLTGLFALPSLLLAYNLAGKGTLVASTMGVGYQRDVRVLVNGQNIQGTHPADAFHPGFTGAAQSIWKASEAWNSNNPLAGKNFDFDWQGLAAGTQVPNDNTVSWGDPLNACVGFTVAYTDWADGVSNGWRISACNQTKSPAGTIFPITWFVNPSGPPPAPANAIFLDLQGVMVHELGHALGLDHSAPDGTALCPSSNCPNHPSMCPIFCTQGVEERTIAQDDANGLQALYGQPAVKPQIDFISGTMQRLTTLIISGQNFFSPCKVKFTAGTGQDLGNIPGVVDAVPISANALMATIPAEAVSGNVLVWNTQGDLLSNPFPIQVLSAPPAPTITEISPAQVPAIGDFLAISGTDLSAVTQVVINGKLIPKFVFPQSTFGLMDGFVVNEGVGKIFVFGYPPADTLGPVDVSLIAVTGNSNILPLEFVATDPPRLIAPALVQSGNSATVKWGGQPGDLAFLILGFSPDAFFFKNQLILSPFQLIPLPLNPAGTGSLTTTIPSLSVGTQLWLQVLTVDPPGQNPASLKVSDIRLMQLVGF